MKPDRKARPDRKAKTAKTDRRGRRERTAKTDLKDRKGHGDRPGTDERAVVSLAVVGAEEQDGWRWVVLQMPPALGITEAFYVAIVRDLSNGRVRYFTFERTVADPRGAVLGEWDEDTHLNHGFCESAELDAFIVSVSVLVGAAVH